MRRAPDPEEVAEMKLEQAEHVLRLAGGGLQTAGRVVLAVSRVSGRALRRGLRNALLALLSGPDGPTLAGAKGGSSAPRRGRPPGSKTKPAPAQRAAPPSNGRLTPEERRAIQLDALARGRATRARNQRQDRADG